MWDFKAIFYNSLHSFFSAQKLILSCSTRITLFTMIWLVFVWIYSSYFLFSQYNHQTVLFPFEKNKLSVSLFESLYNLIKYLI